MNQLADIYTNYTIYTDVTQLINCTLNFHSLRLSLSYGGQVAKSQLWS